MQNRYSAIVFILVILSGCSTVYYNTLEKIGIPKRDVMVHRVEKARDTQEETKEQFKSALAQFTAVTNFSGGNLEEVYNKLNDEYLASVDKAEEVKKRISDIEDVSVALFEEWEEELEQYSSPSLRRSSQQKLNDTRQHYQQLITAMKRAEAKIEPVLSVFKDQVLYLKHNLNAQAIASLKGELDSVESDVSALILAMEKSIDEANAFIRTMEK
ncbi:DUF2959 domain-containing protein [Methylomarinum vadi]|uniref:DUF2959 domain-containing protein n=1 Tax=Methylomarinum vadi TaxID=438855 RepID=UPI0004DF3622|nr:DUF2959 domain-containing protein [Methylomarinum vadi]